MTHDDNLPFPLVPLGPVVNYTVTPQAAGYSSMTFSSFQTSAWEMHPQGFKDKVVALLSAYEDLVAQAHACPATAPECLAEEGRTKVHELRTELGL